MSDNANNVTSTTEASPAPAAAVLKSNDTSKANRVTAQAEPAKPAEAAKPEPVKSEPAASTEPANAGGDDAGNGEHATSADSSARKEGKLPRWVKERMERQRVTVERDTEARVRAELEQRYGQQQQRQPAPTQARDNVQATTDQPKTMADFNFDPDAYMAHLVEREVTRREQAQRDQARHAERQAAEEQFKTRIDDFETRVGDGAWEDIETSPVNTDPAFADMTALFMGGEHDLDVALHLARDLPEARRINALPPLQRALEVAKLVDLFAGKTQAAPEPAKAAPIPKKTTNAPPPPKPLAGTGSPVRDANDPNMTTADRIKAWRNRG